MGTLAYVDMKIGSTREVFSEIFVRKKMLKETEAKYMEELE